MNGNNFISYKAIIGIVLGLLIMVGAGWASMIQSQHTAASERLNKLEANISGIDQHSKDIDDRLSRIENKLDRAICPNQTLKTPIKTPFLNGEN